MNDSADKILNFEYTFLFPTNQKKEYKIEIDKQTKKIINNKQDIQDTYWTELSFHQCENCPLDKAQVKKCPIAVNLQSLIESFQDHISFEDVEIEVKSPQRIYKKTTNLQFGLQSLFGLLMASSGCPNAVFLSPMVLFHLPFADVEETLLRSSSFYLLHQFLNKLHDREFDFSLDGLKDHYKEIEKVNKGIIQRIRAVADKGDATQNAIVILDTFAQMMSMQFSYNFSTLEYIFQY